jgi:tetratricopeptide (TPR) repeat protein
MKKRIFIMIPLLAITAFMTSCALDVTNRRIKPSAYRTEMADPIEENYDIKFERQNETNKGLGLLRGGHVRRALTYWQEVGVAYPENSTAFFNAGGAHELLGELALARDSYIKAIDINERLRRVKDKQLYRSALERVEGFMQEDALYKTGGSEKQPSDPLDDQAE